eukprot:267376-Rhodomonas_salina.1
MWQHVDRRTQKASGWQCGLIQGEGSLRLARGQRIQGCSEGRERERRQGRERARERANSRLRI